MVEKLRREWVDNGVLHWEPVYSAAEVDAYRQSVKALVEAGKAVLNAQKITYVKKRNRRFDFGHSRRRVVAEGVMMTKLPGTMLNYPGITISDAMQAVHSVAVSKGWWRNERYLPELLCLVHSEVSECLEAYRHSNRKGIEEELADIVIRVFDIAAAEGIDLEKAIKEKHDINQKRPYRHGGKKC